jgi:hypothetical protein
MVETDGYILQVSFPIVLKVSPVTGRQAISDPAVKLVPKSNTNEFENINSIADVILFD